MTELLLLPTFDNSSSSATRDNRFVRDLWLWADDIILSWVRVPNGTLSMMFTCYPILMFLASPWIYRFLNSGHFVTLSISKLIFILLTWGKSKSTLFAPFYCGFTTSFYWVWVRNLIKKFDKEFDKKFKNHA